MHPVRHTRSSAASSAASAASLACTPRSGTPTPVVHPPVATRGIKRVTLTSKSNWWMVEMDEEEDSRDRNATTHTFSSEETAVVHDTHPVISQPFADVDPGSRSQSPSPETSPHVFHPPDRHPSVIFSFPTPTAYAAAHNPTAYLTPFATGSTSELFKCIVKKPEVVQLELNGELQSNASDVTTQFLAELRVYTTIGRHRNIVGFLGCLEGVGMVLEFVDGRTLLDVVRERPELTRERKIDFHNQLLDGLSHLHAHGLSHGDLSLLNVYVTKTDTIKILDFGRSVSADSAFAAPDAAPADPFAFLARTKTSGRLYAHPLHAKRRKIEQIHRGTRPFTAPEIIRGECTDARLADAYSFGVILVCLDLCVLVDCDPEIQVRDEIPPHFLDGCQLFRDRIVWYLQRADRRRRLSTDDFIAVKRWWDEED
ncbi:kinase-like protein [Fomitiporia mediterranea MF3/22]|uniref:kinase-like protein n=1 Tax=Fomitiporia mediterranea (strain MF3/22) TaxID=694068 RepID=UPI0004408359|nr:kinase-like protein [Fomitiporia mediterranea MF3/22]EJD03031.1 kinase-like protein [Fomitiporia mediterranea MF3/22]